MRFTERTILSFELTDKYAAVYQDDPQSKKYHIVVDAIGLVRQQLWQLNDDSTKYLHDRKVKCLEEDDIMMSLELTDEGFFISDEASSFIRLVKVSQLADDEKAGLTDGTA